MSHFRLEFTIAPVSSVACKRGLRMCPMLLGFHPGGQTGWYRCGAFQASGQALETTRAGNPRRLPVCIEKEPSATGQGGKD